jgi:D-glutamate N-acetyltransferase
VPNVAPGSRRRNPVPRRYLVLAEGHATDPHHGKTMRGLLRYRRDEVVAILDSEHAGEEVEGVPVVATVAEGLGHSPTAAFIGVAPAGGRLPAVWDPILRDAVEAGLDVESGMHVFLADDPELAALASERGVELRDLRRPPAGLSVPTGANLEHGAAVVLTVGSDCAIGKMTVSLELDRSARERGLASVFVPTGQTGIAIAGWGVCVDAVVADFIAGATERLVVEGADRGDLLWVEGQGSLVHPQYSGVTLGLFHGSAPHVLVLCHEAGTTQIEGCPGHPIPPLRELVELHERMSLPARKTQVAAVALNTRRLDEREARAAATAVEDEVGLPADDPVRFGADRLLDAVLAALPERYARSLNAIAAR